MEVIVFYLDFPYAQSIYFGLRRIFKYHQLSDVQGYKDELWLMKKQEDESIEHKVNDERVLYVMLDVSNT